jgi:hypothetical protein
LLFQFGQTGNFTAAGTLTSTNITTPLVIGGTAVSSALTLQSTSGAGTTDYVAFKTGSQSERMRITTAGDVGIGTSTPGALLHVSNGSAKVRIGLTASNQYADIYRDSATGCTIYNAAQSSPYTGHVWQVASTEYMRISSAGLVGIGTTSPAGQLTVQGAGQTVSAFNTAGALGGAIVLSDTGAVGGNGGAIVFAAASQAWKFAAIKGFVQSGAGNTVGDIVFSTRPTTADATLTEAMRVAYTGRVGIGNSTPTTTLDVTGTLRVSGAVTFTTALTAANGGTGLSSSGASGNVLTSNGSSWVSSVPSSGGSNLYLYVNNGGF